MTENWCNDLIIFACFLRKFTYNISEINVIIIKAVPKKEQSTASQCCMLFVVNSNRGSYVWPFHSMAFL